MNITSISIVPCEVLIESDWNLKPDMKLALKDFQDGINRIRLEFKVLQKHFLP